jgi:hypothetical protein
MANNALELEGASAIGGAVQESLKSKSISLGKQKKTAVVSKASKDKKQKPAKTGRTPSASNVRAAMAGGHITPEEAGHLNPNAGYKPEWNDVRDAFNSGHITVEEASDLLNKKPKQPKESSKGPQWVKSEQVKPEKTTTPSNSVSSPRPQITAGNAQRTYEGKQFKGSTARLAGNRLSWKEMSTGKYAGALMSGKDLNKRLGIKVGERPSTRAEKDPAYKKELLAKLEKEVAKRGD